MSVRTIRTVVDEETYKSLTRKRKKEGVPSISALFLKGCDELTDDKEAGEIVREAIRLAARREVDEEFKLQDLFPQKRWETFNKGARLRAGRMFKAHVDGATAGIRSVRKSGSNHQLYVRAT